MKLALLWATYLLESHGEENLQCDFTSLKQCIWSFLNTVVTIVSSCYLHYQNSVREIYLWYTNFDCFWMAFVPNISIQTVYQINQIGKMNFFSLKKLILPIWLIWYTVWVEIFGTNAIQKQSKFHNGDFKYLVIINGIVFFNLRM